MRRARVNICAVFTAPSSSVPPPTLTLTLTLCRSSFFSFSFPHFSSFTATSCAYLCRSVILCSHSHSLTPCTTYSDSLLWFLWGRQTCAWSVSFTSPFIPQSGSERQERGLNPPPRLPCLEIVSLRSHIVVFLSISPLSLVHLGASLAADSLRLCVQRLSNQTVGEGKHTQRAPAAGVRESSPG